MAMKTHPVTLGVVMLAQHLLLLLVVQEQRRVLLV
jgi:hypothetical protein